MYKVMVKIVLPVQCVVKEEEEEEEKEQRRMSKRGRLNIVEETV